MSKILVTEDLHEAGPKMLEAAGHQVVFAHRDMETIRREIVDADAVFVRILELPGSLLDTAKNLKIVSKHGVGYDNIDLEYCKKRGIPVTITPNANSLAVAEHAFSLLAALAKNVLIVSDAYKQIGFAAKNSKEGTELTGKTVGIIGIGHIGRLFAKICYGGFNMRVLAYDPYVSEVPEGVTLVSDLNEMLAEVDFLSIHANLTEETRHIINRETLSVIKKGAILINCARGPLVDEKALIEALQENWLRGAGLDVTDPEPIDPDSPLLQMKNVIVTPHYAATTLEAAIKVSEIGCQNILACLNGGEMVGRIV